MKDFLTLRIKAIIPETADANTYVLENTEPEPIVYQAGQFLTFLVPHNGHEVRRSYSISSSPEADTELAVTIKRVVNGEISRYLLDTWRVGDLVQSLYPAGRFTLPAGFASPRDIILIGAGSGITPLFSLLKTLLLREPQSRVTLVYANRDWQSTIFKAALDAWAQRYPEQFRCIHILSQEGRGLTTDENVTVRSGRLNNAWLERLVNENLRFRREDALVYLCGPVPVMRMADITLRFMGFRNLQIRQEYFIIRPLTTTEENVVHTDARPSRVKIQYRGRMYDLEVPVYKNILQVALENDIQLPYSCRGGRCSTCIARCVSGTVRMSINEVLTDHDLAEGWVLTCTSRPETAEVTLRIE